jgi:heterodisulfide reductase subunit A-like polyferredoxin
MDTQLRSTPDAGVLIIGAGPVGLYGAYNAGFRGLSVSVMGSLPEPGGQISARSTRSWATRPPVRCPRAGVTGPHGSGCSSDALEHHHGESED